MKLTEYEQKEYEEFKKELDKFVEYLNDNVRWFLSENETEYDYIIDCVIDEYVFNTICVIYDVLHYEHSKTGIRYHGIKISDLRKQFIADITTVAFDVSRCSYIFLSDDTKRPYFILNNITHIKKNICLYETNNDAGKYNDQCRI
jgi:hypothetical protein